MYVLDDQLAASEVLAPLRSWLVIERLQNLRPSELIRDDRVPEILRTLREPTFVTIDQGFWTKRLCDPKYCILVFGLRDDQQSLLPDLLRRLLRQKDDFGTRSKRMGKVARVSLTGHEYWNYENPQKYRTIWSD